MLSRLDGTKRSIVEEQPIGRLSQELQGDVTLEAWLNGREPGVTLAAKAVFGLLALRAVKHGRTLASERWDRVY